MKTLRGPKSWAKPCVTDPNARASVRALLGKHSRQRQYLIEHLHRLQDHFGYLDQPHLIALAEEMGLSVAEVFETATFYHHFDVLQEGARVPPPCTVRVCRSISCDMAGSRSLLQTLSQSLDPARIRVLATPCVGRCDVAPVAIINRFPLSCADQESVCRALAAGDFECPVPDALGYTAYRHQGGYKVLEDCHAGHRDLETVLNALQDSGLRGMGGAGFPAGRKWRTLLEQKKPRMIAVNIDEGEPGTFKDRHYLERDPHRCIEGALIAAWAIQAEAVYLYLRDEYAGCRTLLERERALLMECPPVPLPEIHLRRGAGAYICGEESAMMESIEGKRGLPRLRPPYVAQCGLFGHPTLAHNLETLYWVREIVERGGDWFAAQGMRGRKGLHSFSLSGRVNKPGVYLAPAGTTARELIDEYGGGMQSGHQFYGYFPGGASGGILPASLGDEALDFDTLAVHGCFIGSAAVIVFSDQDSARALAHNAMRFFEDESCGQCTPCRAGTAKMATLMEAEYWDEPLLRELACCMEDASICGLGQAAPNPLRCVLKYFPEEFE